MTLTTEALGEMPDVDAAAMQEVGRVGSKHLANPRVAGDDPEHLG